MAGNWIAAHPIAAYDPFGTTIWLSYDPTPGISLSNDPAFVHELTHYGQNILTGLGIEQTLMFHELYYATVQLLLSESSLHMPLSRCRPKESVPQYWDHADITLAFQRDIIGGLSRKESMEFKESFDDIRSVLGAIYKPGADNPFYFQMKWQGPGFGLKCPNGVNIFFRLNGHFVQEIHARATEFIARWAIERLTIDEAVSYFLFSQNNPYTLLYLAVSKLITERLGEGLFDIQDAIFLCHLCAQIALNAFGLGETSRGLGWHELSTSSIKYPYRDPGELFLLALSAALDQFVEPGWATENYFALLDKTLTKLNWPRFDQVIEHTVEQLVNRISRDDLLTPENSNQDRDLYQAYISQKWLDSKAGLTFLLDQYHQRKVMNFISAPVQITTRGIVRGPTLASPNHYSMIIPHLESSAEWDPVPPAYLMRGFMISVLTNKLWYSEELTCTNPQGAPFHGSIIGCDRSTDCPMRVEAAKGVLVCKAGLWLNAIMDYPGLYSKFKEFDMLAGSQLCER